MVLELAACAGILFVLVFLATVDLAYSHLSDISLRRLFAETDEAGRKSTFEFLREILDNRPLFRFVLSSTIQLLVIAFTVIVTVMMMAITDKPWEILVSALLIGLLATVIFRQIIPRLIIRNRHEAVLLAVLPVVRPIYFLTKGLIGPFRSLFSPAETQQRLETTSTPDSAEPDDDDDENIQALLEVGEAEGIIEEGEREMIESMVEFADTRVAEIMTPRTEICAIQIDSTVRAARDLIIQEKYSRLPVYRESIDNIEGVLYVRDLLIVWAEGGREEQSIAPLLRDPYFVPETKSAAELLTAMQNTHQQIAIAVDEYGGVAGIVTVEDLLEEIVGEIEDEDIEDEEIIEIVEGENGYFDVLGSTEIDKIERLFGLDLEDDDYTTIAGMVTSEAGYVPKMGDRLQIHGLEIEVLRGDEKKLSLLRIKPMPEKADAEGTENV